MKEKTAKSYLSPAQKKTLGEVVRDVPEQVKSAFEKAFSGWKETWFEGPLRSAPTERPSRRKRVSCLDRTRPSSHAPCPGEIG